MPRPRKKRFVSSFPVLEAFGPRGMPPTGIVLITVEEFEAIRLSDFEKLSQEEAASQMGISRHTYGRLLASARAGVAEALVTGKDLCIKGGDFSFRGKGKRHHRGGCGGLGSTK